MKHALKVLFYLKKNEAKEDGMCPVMGRITVGKTMVQFSAKMNVPLSLWDTPSGRANGKSRLATELNRTLDKINVSINTHHKEILAIEMFLGVFHAPGSSQLGFLVHVRNVDAKE